MEEKEFEQKMEEFSRRMEERMKGIEDRIEGQLNTRFGERKRYTHDRRSRDFWGVALIIFGLVLLAEKLIWIRWDIPFWPLAIIAVGAYLIYQSH